jgi:NADH-quinone oxidoreductase subunit C/D
MSAVMVKSPQNQLITDLLTRLDSHEVTIQNTFDDITTLWVPATQLKNILNLLKGKPYDFAMLLDLFGIDERLRKNRKDQPHSDFTLVYHLTSVTNNLDFRIKLALTGDYPTAPSITDLWLNANWYEREAWDMFGIKFNGHPLLRRILTPPTFEGHPLRKEFPCRATEQ